MGRRPRGRRCRRRLRAQGQAINHRSRLQETGREAARRTGVDPAVLPLPPLLGDDPPGPHRRAHGPLAPDDVALERGAGLAETHRAAQAREVGREQERDERVARGRRRRRRRRGGEPRREPLQDVLLPLAPVVRPRPPRHLAPAVLVARSAAVPARLGPRPLALPLERGRAAVPALGALRERRRAALEVLGAEEERRAEAVDRCWVEGREVGVAQGGDERRGEVRRGGGGRRWWGGRRGRGRAQAGALVRRGRGGFGAGRARSRGL